MVVVMADVVTVLVELRVVVNVVDVRSRVVIVVEDLTEVVAEVLEVNDEVRVVVVPDVVGDVVVNDDD